MTQDDSPYLFGEPVQDRLVSILLRAGWSKRSEIPGAYAVWKPMLSDGKSEHGVLVPLEPSSDDYEFLYGDALSDVQRYLGVARFQAIDAEISREAESDLARTSWSREASTRPGTIPWPDGQSVHAAITQQLEAAAKAVVTPGPRLGRSSEYFAREFMAATILAPSGTGSYVVNALTPIHRPIYTSAPPAQDSRRTRQREAVESINVLRRFDQALSAISFALQTRRPEEAANLMAEQSRVGVSFELVTALTQFLGGEEAEIEVPRIVWEPEAAPSVYAFKPPHAHVLGLAAERLKGTEESTRATVTGIITKLEHEPGSDDFVVRVFTTSRGPVRRVSLHVSEEDYERSLLAHGEDSLIRVGGELVKTKGRWTITNPEHFLVLDEGVDDGWHLLPEEQPEWSEDDLP